MEATITVNGAAHTVDVTGAWRHDGRPLSDGPNMLRLDDLSRLLDEIAARRAEGDANSTSYGGGFAGGIYVDGGKDIVIAKLRIRIDLKVFIADIAPAGCQRRSGQKSRSRSRNGNVTHMGFAASDAENASTRPAPISANMTSSRKPIRGNTKVR